MMNRDSHHFREIFDETEILRRPISGIVSGYHLLPYILLGRSHEQTDQVIEIRGKINVSPRFVISPEFFGPTYGEMFGTDGIDESIVGRIFAFQYLKKHQVNVESEHFSVKNIKKGLDSVLAYILDELERKEIIDTGVIVTPNIRFYPISIEKFIVKMLDREFE